MRIPGYDERGMCVWCHAELGGTRWKCDRCKAISAQYVKYAKELRRSMSVHELCEIRNFMFDMRYNMPGAKYLPYDLDYQLDRVNRYLNEKS